jgi:hypothetical protein
MQLARTPPAPRPSALLDAPQVELHALAGLDQGGVAHAQAVPHEVWHRCVCRARVCCSALAMLLVQACRPSTCRHAAAAAPPAHLAPNKQPPRSQHTMYTPHARPAVTAAAAAAAAAWRARTGSWVQIQATGLLPGKMIQQLCGATQRLMGQQSLAGARQPRPATRCCCCCLAACQQAPRSTAWLSALHAPPNTHAVLCATPAPPRLTHTRMHTHTHMHTHVHTHDAVACRV